MKEKHFAYQISQSPEGIVCTHHEFEEDHMLDLLKNIKASPSKGLFWVFKQLNGRPKEALSIIDCAHGRIYYHFSGEVEDIELTIRRLEKKSVSL